MTRPVTPADRVASRYLSAARVAERYMRKTSAVDEEKMRAMLLKLRKGATSFLNWKTLSEILPYIDPKWKVEKVVDLVPLHHSTPDTYWGYDETEDVIQETYEIYQKYKVNSVPTSPKPGQIYVTRLDPLRQGNRGWEFDWEGWIGNEGWRLTSPQGQVFTALPSSFDVARRDQQLRKLGAEAIKAAKIPIYNALRWLVTETQWKAEINAKLEMEEHVPGAVRSKDGTGTCSWCFANVKMSGSKLTLHGYRRPGYGTTVGRCGGMDFPALELSSEGASVCQAHNKKSLKEYEDILKKLEDGKILKLPRSPLDPESEKVTLGDPLWDRTLALHKSSVSSAVRDMGDAVDLFTKVLRAWKLRPLPVEGERQRTPRFFL